MGVPAFAADYGVQYKLSDTFVVNEYEYIRNLQKMTLEEALEAGYTAEQYEELQSIDYKAEMLKRAELPNSQLENMGYTSEVIAILKDMLIHPDRPVNLATVASNCTLSIAQNSYSNTSRKFTVSFLWNSMPVVKITDILCVSWCGVDNRGYYLDTPISGSATGSVTYYNASTGRYGYKESIIPYTGSIRDSRILQFPAAVDLGYSGNWHWAKLGSMTLTVKFSANNTLNYLSVLVGYGHQTVRASSPTASFSLSGISLSITFSTYVESKTQGYLLKGRGGVVRA